MKRTGTLARGAEKVIQIPVEPGDRMPFAQFGGMHAMDVMDAMDAMDAMHAVHAVMFVRSFAKICQVYWQRSRGHFL